MTGVRTETKRLIVTLDGMMTVVTGVLELWVFSILVGVIETLADGGWTQGFSVVRTPRVG